MRGLAVVISWPDGLALIPHGSGFAAQMAAPKGENGLQAILISNLL